MNDFCVRRYVGAAEGEADSFPRDAATREPVRFPYRLADINSAIRRQLDLVAHPLFLAFTNSPAIRSASPSGS
jgi:hypothetical protein